MAKQAARVATDANAAILNSFAKTDKPKTGVKAGLREGESRVTCVLTDEQNQLLHDWAKTTGRTFREVTMSMAYKYIDEVIAMAVDDGMKLERGEKEPPERYADWYKDDASEDKFARYF